MSAAEIHSPSSTLPDKEHRKRIPLWGWVPGVIFFPSGLFLTLGSARVMKWRTAVPLAACAWAVQMAFVKGMALMGDRFPEGSAYLLLGFWFSTLSVAQLQYAIGAKHGLWSDTARRVWRILGYFGAGIAVLGLLTFAMRVIGSALGIALHP